MSIREELLKDLLDLNVVKYGDFLLKSGARSPIYMDIRSIVSKPETLEKMARTIRHFQAQSEIKTNVVCGVPYVALPIATAFSVLFKVPMVMKRKEMKKYGTGKMVEGQWEKGDKCLIIEDIATSGSSIVETAECLRSLGLDITDCIVVIDRLQGARENLISAGINLHSLFNVRELFSAYVSNCQSLDPNLVTTVERYLADNTYIPIQDMDLPSYTKRAESCKHPLAKSLLELMASKKTNLCVAADCTTSEDLIKLAEEIGPHICILKTHVDILTDFTVSTVSALRSLAEKHNFLILEDRKFADIGNTVFSQYGGGVYCIENWADIVTVHALPGDGVIEGLQKVCTDLFKRGCVLVAEMSSQGSLAGDSYAESSLEMAKRHPDFCLGFISQHRLTKEPGFIHMTPGVSLASPGDGLGQKYRSPEQAVSAGADVIIVGRGIYQSQDRVAAALEYKTRGYSAYVKKCGDSV